MENISVRQLIKEGYLCDYNIKLTGRRNKMKHYQIKIISVKHARGYPEGNLPKVGQIFGRPFITERVANNYANELGRLYSIKATVIVAEEKETA